MDFLFAVLCISIGQVVAWLIALYTDRGFHLLLWNSLFGTVGVALCALVITWVAPTLGIVWLLTVGPLCAVLMIIAGHAIRRSLVA